jgi:hypothetical protein
MTAFWDTAPFSLVEVDRRFRGAYSLHHQDETSVNFYETTKRNIPEGCHLRTLRRENLKSHKAIIMHSSCRRRWRKRIDRRRRKRGRRRRIRSRKILEE